MTRLIAFLAASLLAVSARAEEVLTLHTFMSPKSPTVTKMLEPWAERIAEKSGGKLRVEIFPSMAMGGKPPELYKQVRDGVADIVWTLPGYTPGVFPRSEVFELPTIHGGDAKATTLAIQELMPMIAEDFEDIHPLLIHVHAGNAIHLAENEIAGPNGLKGLKLRTPSRTGAWLIEALGAEPVGMPLPALPQALSKNGVDGALVPFEIFPPFKLQELTKFSAEGEDGTRFGTSVFLFAMNKDRFESLPDDLKAVIEDVSGPEFAAEMGAVWNANEAPGISFQEAAGNKVMRFDAATMAAFATRGESVVARWVEASQTQGFDGAALVEAARAAVAKHSE
ncbi:MAG: TRAP transporter substrate-binding protein [Pseudomonadota bacterium]